MTDVNVAAALASTLCQSGKNVYFACAKFETNKNRTGNNASGAHCFWLDLDCGAEKAKTGTGYASKRDAIAALDFFWKSVGLPRPSIVVDSGNGVHVYWTFADFIPKDEWRKTAKKIKVVAKSVGLIADPTRTGDIASVLRVPGTVNFKNPLHPKPVEIRIVTNG